MMKKRDFVLVLTLMLILGFTAVAVAAKNDAVRFTTTRIDFGNVPAGGGLVKMEYEFTNTGKSPVSVVTVTNGGCHCTKPKFPKEPIAPGRKGIITIQFDPRSYKGEVNRNVKVQFSNSSKRIKLTFNGVVIP